MQPDQEGAEPAECREVGTPCGADKDRRTRAYWRQRRTLCCESAGAGTSRLPFPSCRFCIVFSLTGRREPRRAL